MTADVSQVTVAGEGIVFACAPGQTVLDAAEAAGFALPYSCRKGVCSSCEATLVAGEAQVRGQGRVSGPAEAVRLCLARPCSDLTIVPPWIERRGPPARKQLTARVHRIDRPSTDVTILKLRFPNGVRAKFRAGQYLKLLLEDGDSRDYSLANPPQHNDGAELHIRDLEGGAFSRGRLPGLKPGDTLRVELPYGEAYLDEASERPLIIVATGTGFAPAKAIIEDHLRRRMTRPTTLYWGGRRIEDLYLADLAASWAEQAPWFRFVPVLSQPAGGWSGRTGRAPAAVLEDWPSLAGCEVYACGNPAMTTEARAAFCGPGGLPVVDFHCDAFVPSGDQPQEAP